MMHGSSIFKMFFVNVILMILMITMAKMIRMIWMKMTIRTNELL